MKLRLVSLAVAMAVMVIICGCEKATQNKEAVPEPRYGSVAVKTNPSGMTFRVDYSQEVDYISPDTLDSVEVGTHTLSIRQDDFFWSTEFEVAEGVTTELTIDCTATLTVRTNPPGAQVIINKVATGTVTPYTVTQFPSEYRVRLLLAGYYPVSFIVNAEMGQVIDTTISFITAPAGRIIYTSGSSIYLVGRDGLNPQKVAGDYCDYREHFYENHGLFITMSPDKRHFVYTTADYRLKVGSIDGSLSRVITGLTGVEDYNWSHSGRYIVYGVYLEGIFRYDIQLNKTVRLFATSEYTYDHNPAYSPDDSQIVFVHNELGSNAWLRVMNANGANARSVSEMFRTQHDEFIRLRWISETVILYQTRGDPKGVFTLTPGAGSGLIAPVSVFPFPENVASVSISDDNTRFAYAQELPWQGYSSSVLVRGDVGPWTLQLISECPKEWDYIYWGGGDTGLLCATRSNIIIGSNISNYRIIKSIDWVTLSGESYRIVEECMTPIGYGVPVD
ncbi:MAG: PEGA domain-containing protein [Patescibacteria group bacterium]|jgi:hypothetical protein